MRNEIIIKFMAMMANIVYSISAKAADDESYNGKWMEAKTWRMTRLPEFAGAPAYQGRHET